jgi:hypothetical protein
VLDERTWFVVFGLSFWMKVAGVERGAKMTQDVSESQTRILVRTRSLE